MKAVKILMVALASVLLLLVAGALLLVWLFDPNDYKDYLANMVEERTGRELRVQDDLELSFFPWLAVETGGVTLGNAPGFESLPFATVERAAVRVKLMPLLNRQIEVGTLVLEGLTLNLARDAEGRGNWEDLLAANDQNGAPETETDPGAAWLQDLQVEGLRVRNGTVSWYENNDELRYVVSSLRLESGPIALGAPIDLELGLQALDAATQTTLGLAGRVTLRTGADGGADASDLRLDFSYADGQTPQRAEGRLDARRVVAHVTGEVELGESTLSARLAGLPERPAPIDAVVRVASAVYDPASEALRVAQLRTETAGIEAAWELTAAGVASDPSVQGSVELGPAPLAGLLDLLAVELPEGVAPQELGDISLSSRFEGALEPQRLALSDLDARLLGVQLLGGVNLNGQRAGGRVEIPEFTPGAALLAVAEPLLPELDLAAAGSMSVAASFDADLDAGSAALRDLTAGLFGATLRGELDVAPSGDGLLVSGSLTSSDFPPERFASVFSRVLPQALTPEQLGTLAIRTRFALDTGQDSLALDALDARAFGLSASGRIAGRAVSTGGTWTGEARVEPFSPRDLLLRFEEPPPETSDATVLTRAAAEARFEVTSERGRFDDIVLALDDSRITGSFTVEGFDDPAYVFALAIDRVNVDRYLPPQAQDAEPGEAIAGEMELPVDSLNALKLQGSVRAGELRMAGLDFQDMSAEMSWGDGLARLDSARANLYGGEFQGRFSVDGRGSQPSLALNGRATGIQLTPIIVALTGDANISGTGSFDIDLQGAGATVIENVQSAAGTASFALRNGAISGFNLGRGLCQAYNLTQRLPAPPSQARETAYEVIQGTANVSAGVASSPDLLARSSFMEVTGSGTLVLVEQRLNYDLEAELTGSLGIPNCESMDSLIGESIPLRLRGPVTDPEIAPDYGEILERRLRREAERRVTDRLRDLLR